MLSTPEYEFMPHTADAKFRAYGGSLEEAFTNAARATASLMWDWKAVRPRLEQAVHVRGRDLPQLLVGFLEEILFLLETREFLLHGIKDLIIRKNDSGYELEARFQGDRLDQQYEINGDVKAITYNEMMIEENDRVQIQVVVDV